MTSAPRRRTPDAIAHLGGAELAALLLESMPIAVVVASPDGRLLEVNPAAHELFEVDEIPETVAELRRALEVRDFETGEPIGPEGSLLRSALGGASAERRQTLRALRSDASRVVDAAARPVHDSAGRVIAAVLTFTDVTALVEADRMREEFLSIVSHELRTPLTPLKAIAQLIRGRIRRARSSGAEPDLDALEKNLATIERQVDRMNGLVNDLLEVSRVGRDAFHLSPKPFDVAVIVRDVVQRYIEVTADEGRHAFSLDAPESLRVVADQARVEQLLWNVIGNAVKYSPRGGTVRVRLGRQGKCAVIVVADEGIGISRPDLARLGRRPFQRGAGKAASFAGMGIGLYLSRLVAEGHGGAIEIASDGVDRGTTVTARFPLTADGSGDIVTAL
ncbi:MAG: PAS domain-containing protein [Actinobacteria bacterium]|nr:PAS domain-containing protein [Actinomycetota bacterium]